MAPVAQRKYSPRRPREERREQLLDGALRVLDADGFGGLTIEGVAREVDLAKTVVYDTFGRREELLRALLMREQERALSTLPAAHALVAFGEAAIRLALTQPDRFPPERFAGFAADLLATIAGPPARSAE